MNVVILMGRLTDHPEIRTTSSGISYCRFSLAVRRSYSKTGDNTDFINCVAWRQTAEFLHQYFSKGSMVAVEGRLQQNSYTNKDGVKVNTYDVQVDQVHFTGEKRDQSGSGQGGSYTGSRGSYDPQPSYRDQNRGYDSAPVQAAPAVPYSSGSSEDYSDLPVDEDLPF